MPMTCSLRSVLCALTLMACLPLPCGVQSQALTAAFTYQGELRTQLGPASGSFDMEFRLFDALSGGAQLGATVVVGGVAVSGGLFSVPLDFGAAQFAGDRQWLELRIAPAGSGQFETLAPRSEVTAAPYAWAAAQALNNSVTSLSIVDGSIAASDIDATQVQRRVTGTCNVGQMVRAIHQDGSVTCAADQDAGGTVTQILAGTGLAGGPITGTGTLSIANEGVRAAQVDSTEVQLRIANTCAAGQFMRGADKDGTALCGMDSTGPAAWELVGNAATTPGTHFVGTTDAQPLELHVDSARALRLEPSAVLDAGLPITSNVIGGSRSNAVTSGARGAVVAGGGAPALTDPDATSEDVNRVTDHYGVVSGGLNNLAGDAAGSVSDAMFASVGGGRSNIASGADSRIGGGRQNLASGTFSMVGGGQSNRASAFSSGVLGGASNYATGDYDSVQGGLQNTASGGASAVGGGSDNCAGGRWSWVAGLHAKVRPGTDAGEAGDGCAGVTSSGDADGDNGTFAWADSQSSDFVSTGPNQFLVRASGGIYLGTNNTVDIPAGRFINTSTGAHLTTGGAWTNSSSRTQKEGFAALRPGEVLERLLRLDILTWRYRQSAAEGRHLGPIAEDFHALFGLGADPRAISTVDASGVALAAIQDLHAKLENENEALRTQNASLRERLDALERRQAEILQRLHIEPSQENLRVR